MKKRILLIAFTTVVFVAFNNFSTVSSGQNADSSDALFTIRETPQFKSQKSSIAAKRESEIEFVRRNPRENDRETLSLTLFDGKNYAAKRTSTEARAADDFTWRGKIIEGKIENDVVLTFKNGYVSGLIYAANAVYEIVVRGEQQILVEIDQNKYPECAGDVKGVENESEPSALLNKTTTAASVDSGDRIDVLVVYTAAVKTSLGGEAQAQTFAQQAIDSTNTTYINSKIRQRVRLAGAVETTLAESGTLSGELSTVRADPAVAALREQYKADLVAMISNSTDNCGIGYLLGSGNSLNGFTVNSRTCAVGNLSFAHELGHNMGSTHNPENGSAPSYSYGYGHYVNGVFRTVMSYTDPCTMGCARRPYFSNPEVLFGGLPTGIENARDNARSINNTADRIANYRYSGANLALENFNGGDALPRNIKRTVNWSSENIAGNVKIELSRDGGTTWKTLAADTPNDGAETIVINGNATRRARLRISSVSNPMYSDSSVQNVLIR